MALYELPPEEPATSDDLEALHRELRDALEQLSEEERILIEWRYMESMSYSEIAKRLGVSNATLSSRLHRTMQKLRALIKTED